MGCAVALYSWNAEVSGAFLEVLHHLEVMLRSAVDRELSACEVPESARLTPAAGWWFASATFVEKEGLRVVEQTRSRLGTGPGDKRERVLSELTFGFWQGLFGTAYEDLFRRHLVSCFPDRPQSGFSRKTVVRALDRLRILRNRIAHHQSILDYPIAELHETALDLIGWMSSGGRTWVAERSRVPEVLEARPQPVPPIAVVVPAAEAWGLYEESRAYVCQAGRFFRDVSHIAFYRKSAIEPEIAAIQHRLDDVPFSQAEVGNLFRSHDPEKMRLAEVMREAIRRGWTGSTYQVFLLSAPGEPRHVTRSARIAHTATGQGKAFVQRQRYFPLETLRHASSTADLL